MSITRARIPERVVRTTGKGENNNNVESKSVLETEDKPAVPPKMSAQQIMRARYKQQMIPPRTWKQAEAEKARIDRASKERNINSRATYLAAAAKAGSAAAASIGTTQVRSQPSTPLHAVGHVKHKQPVELNSMESAASAASATSSFSSQSHSLHDSESPTTPRPPMLRHSSSTSLLSRAAAIAAQSMPRRGSSSSVTSPLTNSNFSSRSNSTASELVPDSGNSPSTSGGGASLRRSSRDRIKHAPNIVPQNSLKSQKQASAAARASLSKPINVAPRGSTTAKFVSSLSQALRREHEQSWKADQLEPDEPNEKTSPNHIRGNEARRSEEWQQNPKSNRPSSTVVNRENREGSAKSLYAQSHVQPLVIKPSASNSAALIAANNAPMNRKSMDSTQSYGSFGSYGLYGNESINAASSVESEKRRKLEDLKSNALQAAMTAGTRVEANMASIHMQVNAAVQAAHSKRNRRELARNYLPGASWSVPSKLIRFRRQQPSSENPQSSGKSAGSSSHSNAPRNAFDNIMEAYHPSNNGGDLYATHSAQQSMSSLHSVGSSQSHVSSPTTSHPPSPDLGSHHLLSSSTPHQNAPRLLQSLRSGKTQRRRRERDSIQPREHLTKDVSELGHGCQEKKSYPVPSPGLVSSSASSQQSSHINHMRLTLRGDGRNKNFNEDKPWKGHKFQTDISDKERRRYEGLWATNKGRHLPWLYIDPQYQHAWDDGIALTMAKSQSKRLVPSSQCSMDLLTYSHRPSRSVSSIATTLSGVSTEDQDSYWRNGMPAVVGETGCEERRINNGLENDAALTVARAERAVEKQLEDKNTLDTVPEMDTVQELFGEAQDTKSLETFNTQETGTGSETADVESIASDVDSVVDAVSEVKRRVNDVHGYAVSRLWRRSRLSEETLAQVWDLVDTNKDGTLERSGFVVGMWLCDQCLYGRKLPSKVSPEIWQSAGQLNVKIRVKPRKTKFGYVRKLPGFFGNAMEITMHSGKQAMKKAVQTATS